MSSLETRAARYVANRVDRRQAGWDLLGCDSLYDIAKDQVTHRDRRADDSGQKKVQTADG
jgi:hypothetical protein